ncbi:MAG: pentapeptide repeat-containing protein [Fischerella sp. CENA71]|nr:pentapeptide repeat-containing protein [Fischerella sp. CENA71]
MMLDYSGQNLRGRSFKGQNLTGANFSKADIRGANFSNAILKDVDFTSAKAGLQRRWVIGLLIISCFVLAVSGYLSIIISSSLAYIFKFTNTLEFLGGIIALVIVVVFCIITIRKGLTAGFGFLAGALAVAVAIPIAILYAFVLADAGFVGVAGAIALGVVLGVGFAFTVAIAFAVSGAFAFAVAGAIGGAGAFVVAVAGPIAGAFAGAVAGAFAFAAGAFAVNIAGAFVVTIVGAVALILFSVYIGRRSLAGDEKDAWLRSVALAFTATGGTSFRNADLTDADFTSATLKNTDFRKANLTHTRFYEAKKLDFARVGNTILTKLSVLKLLVTGNGRGKSYVGANLKGANLIGADLKETNLKNANINEATFQRACLEGANLTLTQAVSTDFSSSQMTSACVEAWNIESTTKLNNVDCRFIYLLEHPKPETDDRERRPSSGDFQAGEFTKLFEEVLNTVDLIFRNGIDWKAFVTAFKKVQVENEDTELAIQSIENKDGVFIIRIKVPVDADKEKIHSDLMQTYQLTLKEVEKYKALSQARYDEIIRKSAEMTTIVSLLAAQTRNVQNFQFGDNEGYISMTNSNDASRNINIGSVGRDFNASGQALNLGEISGTVTNTINELPKSSEPEKPGIKELLTQLQTAIEADNNLSDEDKAEALEQVKALAEAGKNPQEGAMQKSAKTAMKILKGTISNFPTAATLVEACSKLLPLISKFLGFG